MNTHFPLAKIALATLFGLVFGTFARDVARWSVCLTSSSTECSHDNIVTAELIAVLLSTFVALYFATIAAKEKPQGQNETAGLMIGILLGAFFTMLKVVEKKSQGYPDFTDNFAAPIIFLLVVVVVLPLALHRLSDPLVRDPLAPLRRLGRVFIISFFLGGFYWWLAHLALEPNNTSTTKFVVAPGVSVIVGATFGVSMLHARARRQPNLWILLYALAGVVFALAWYWLDYRPRQEQDPDNWGARWLGMGLSRGRWMLDAPMLLILISSVMMMAAIMSFRDRFSLTTRNLAIATCFALVSAACGFWLGLARINAGTATANAPLVLALVHGLGPPLALASLILGLRHNKTRRNGPTD